MQIRTSKCVGGGGGTIAEHSVNVTRPPVLKAGGRETNRMEPHMTFLSHYDYV